MAIKCESCKHHRDQSDRQFNDRYCWNVSISRDGLHDRPVQNPLPILQAREICDREGNGIFVYFEPKQPSAGAAIEPSCGEGCGHSDDEHAAFDAGLRGEPNPNPDLREEHETGRSVYDLLHQKAAAAGA